MDNVHAATDLDTSISNSFFIKDVIDQENLDVRHCSTEHMIADYFTKPLQGSLFKKMRAIVMGSSSPILEERVEVN